MNTPHPPRDDTETALHKRVVVPAKLSGRERTELAEDLYAVHERIFSGVSAEHFRLHVIEPEAEATAIQLYLTAENRIVGYCAIHRFRRRVKGRDALVLRAEAGLMPEYRGRGRTYEFGIVRAMRTKLLHPFTPIYYLGTLVHTSSYHLFCKYFPQIFPHPVLKAPDDLGTIARDLADSFSNPRVHPDDPYLRDVGWITIETPQEKALNQRRNQPDVDFFRQRNPGYDRGHGLVIVVPLTFGNIFAALLRRLAERVRLTIGRHRPDL